MLLLQQVNAFYISFSLSTFPFHLFYLFIFPLLFLLFNFGIRHHNPANNKTKTTTILDKSLLENVKKSQKHNEMDGMQHQIGKNVESDRNAENSNLILKRYSLQSVPFAHAHYLYSNDGKVNGTEEFVDFSIRNRSSKQKRTAADVHFSKNISMVLEKLLEHYESSYLPTHGQGN